MPKSGSKNDTPREIVLGKKLIICTILRNLLVKGVIEEGWLSSLRVETLPNLFCKWTMLKKMKMIFHLYITECTILVCKPYEISFNWQTLKRKFPKEKLHRWRDLKLPNPFIISTLLITMVFDLVY